MTVFNILNNRVKELAVSRFEKPTLVQQLALPKVLEGKNILVLAETGSGKTESVILGVFSKLVENNHPPISVLYITPMKALNRDLLDRLVWWCNNLDLEVSVRHGDTTQHERKLQLNFPPEILITTPEQIGAMLTAKKFREHLKNIKWVIIDECVSGDTRVTLSNGNNVNIKQLFESNASKRRMSIKPTKKIYVKSLDANGKIIDTEIKRIYKIPLKKRLFYLRTKFYNIELMATEDHNILTESNGTMIWKEFRNLEIDDNIVVSPNIFSTTEIRNMKPKINKTILDESKFIKTYSQLFGKLKGSGKKVREGKLKSVSSRLLPLKTSDYGTKIFARLLGHIFGDGWITITKDTKSVGFSAPMEDLKAIEKDLNFIGFRTKTKVKRLTKSQINSYDKSYKVTGTSLQMSNGSKSLIALLVSMGAPYGEKTDKDYTIPKWILGGDKEIKGNFLSAFIGSEFPRFKGRKSLDFDAIRFSVFKRADKIKFGTKLVKAIELLLKEFGVRISKVNEKEGNIRKDGSRTKALVITVSNSEENIINLIRNIGVSYNTEKSHIYKRILEYLICKKFARDKKIKLKNKIFKMKLSGIRNLEVAKTFAFDKQLNRHGLQYGNKCKDIIQSWLRTKNVQLRDFPSFNEWNKNYCKGDILIDKIVAITKCTKNDKYVYDLTVERTHNFLANDIIVHNCHELAPNKRGVQLTLALERLKRLCGEPQMLALSATVGSPETVAKFIFPNKKYEIINAISPKDMELKVESPYPSRKDREIAEKTFIGESVAARLRMIHDYILEHRSVLTFTNTREAAEVLSSRLRLLDKDFPHDIHHSSLSKEVRIKAEKEFKSEKLKALISTSSLQLGIDIGSVDLTIQYQSPRTVTQLIQRCGRSGHRIGRVSKGIIIAGEGDDIFESAVIARKALAGELEQIRTHKNSLDVLTHQIIGMSMEEYGIDPKEVFRIVKGAEPYKDLSEKEFLELINFLSKQLRLVFADRGGLNRSRKAFPYYFENLSVIPDSKTYRVMDTTSNMVVGTLDEEFIATHGEVGSSFIVKGMPWKILSVDNERVYVEPINDIESSIPAWEGELIPVPFSVAQEVGILRREIGKMLNEKLDDEKIIAKLKEKYPVSSQSAEKMVQSIKSQIKKYPLPDNQKIIVEKFEDYVVLHSPFGTLVNETLSRFIASVLSAEQVITSRTDPYRMIFKGCSAEEIKKVLFNYKPEDIVTFLTGDLPRSSLFKFRFLHISKRFGVLSKKASLEKINVDKFIDVYRYSPIYQETLQELFTEKLDLERAKEVMKDLQSDKMKFEIIEGLSPLAELGFRYELQDVTKPNRPEKEIFNIFKRRLLNSKVRLLCVHCGNYSITQYVKNVEKEPRCRKCLSRLIAILKPHRIEAQEIVKKRLKGQELTEEEMGKLGFIKRSADLTIVYGKKAAIALAGRGIGPQTAARVLARMHKNDDELYRDILNAERQFIATKKYWD